ncbi:efflux RND transporter periplasmic adaptor subunit [Xylanibacter muris]|uniref:Efflux RND transporter periplasmic adaptor subunit n=2 Tax=Xylanibacter muris TaxID=2736290 RepID=A0ABX2ANS8_9BACT|nr:efflux RND transporter periplasmic adaptor subunit [Xylanibacter muris]
MGKNKMMLIAAFAVMLVSCGGGKQGKPNFGDNEYAVRTINAEKALLQTTYPATVKGVQDVEIRPKVAGFITKLNVHEGQTVKKGQVLFIIDNVTYEAAVRQAKAAVNAAKAQLNTSKLTFENSKKLFENNVIGDYEMQSARNAYESAQAALAQAEASYVSAKQNLDFCYVSSPADGVVGELPYKVGALVSSSSQQPLTTVSDNKSMQVYFSLTEKELMGLSKTSGGIAAAIKDFPPVRLQLADGSLYATEGHIAAVSGVIDATKGTVQVRADFDNPEHFLKSGASGYIVIPQVAQNAIVVPQDAVIQVQDKYFVYVVGKDSKVKYTPVTVNPENNGKTYIIESGLKVGETIVVYGVTSLTDGMEIKQLSEKQYAEKLQKAEKLGEAQGDLEEFKKAMGM